MTRGERTARVAELIQREAARVLLEEASDDRLRGVTVTGVRVSRDLRHARILYTAAAGRRAELERRAKRFESFLQRELARRLRLRFAVRVVFAYDGGVDHAMRLEEVFAEIHRTEQERGRADGGEAPAGGEAEDGGGVGDGDRGDGGGEEGQG